MNNLTHIMKRVSGMVGRGRVFFDPSTLDDPVAEKTSWMPLRKGGTNFGTHLFSVEDQSRARFKASIPGLLFPSVFIAVGAAVSLGMGGYAYLNQDWPLLVTIPFGGTFFAIGMFLLRRTTAPRVFDKMSGYYQRGRGERGVNNSCALAEIHAIQLIAEYIPGSSSSSTTGSSSPYYSYELNLVLKNGTRLNVVDHANQNQIIHDGEQLSDFLSVPLWNAL